MSSDRLAGIRAYVELASPGPWSKAVFAFGPPEGGDLSPVAHTRADAEFIVRARTDLPLLLEVASAAREFEAHFAVPRGPHNECAAAQLALRAALDRLGAGS